MPEFSKKMHNLSKGAESLSKEEHGLLFDTIQRLGLTTEVKQAAIALYLDFKSRPVGEYNSGRKNLEIFLIASISLAAKAIGDFRTDREFESKMFVSKERLADAEERILKSFGVRDTIIPFSELLTRLTRRQIETMAESFAERGLVSADERDAIIRQSLEDLSEASSRGLNPKMGYRGRASGLVLRAVRDLSIEISESEIARAAGFDKKSMTANANVINTLLGGPRARDRERHANSS